MSAPRKSQDLVTTKRLRPVGKKDEHVHHPRLEFNAFTLKGTVECLLVCEDGCPQRAKLWEKAVPGFHAPPKGDEK